MPSTPGEGPRGPSRTPSGEAGRRPHGFVSRRGRYYARVAYADTDKARVLHHAAYLRFLEMARVELWREGGLDYRRFEEETGNGLPVVEARLRYRVSARFDDLLEVETWVKTANRASIWYDAVIRRMPRDGAADGERVLLLESSIRLACVSLEQGALRRIPDAVLDGSLEPGWDV